MIVALVVLATVAAFVALTAVLRWGIFGELAESAVWAGATVLIVVVLVGVLTACGTGGPKEQFAAALERAEYGRLTVIEDREGKRHTLVAFDAYWRYGGCDIELEWPARNGVLKANAGWHIDEVKDANGKTHDAEDAGWGAGSPVRTTTIRLIAEHEVKC